MFKVGDRVVYPMHGAGVVESIEEREVLGQVHKYYVLRLSFGDMKVMVPVDSADEVGLRKVISDAEVNAVLEVLKAECTAMSPNWNRRYRSNLEKIKSGSIYEVADVVRNLTMRDKEKGLSTGERKMLDSAKEILISELTLVKGWKREEAETVLQQILA
ncbi:MAG: CarD family transcriptional regulator [Firmicutes bacterium]|nr:CarD family transcriptional regulator [Candidatus Fermentithermobacillaceae bacterium]